MNYCPGCQEPIEADEYQCPYCGYELIATNNEDIPGFAKSLNKPFYKSGAFIGSVLGLIILAIIITGAIFGYDYYKDKQEAGFQKDLKAIWLETTNRSDQLSSSIDLVNNTSDFEDLNDELAKFSDFLSTQQTEAINLEPEEKYEDNQRVLVDSIEKYNKYTYLLKLILQKDITLINDKDYLKLKSLADDSSAATDKFVAEVPYIEGKIPPNIFQAMDKLRPIIEKEQKAIANRQKETQALEQNTQKREAERVVRSFMQAKIDKSAAEMRRYITPAYDKVFDPEQEFAVTDTYSIDFKITKTESVNENEFAINGDEIGKDLTGAKFTNKWLFKIVKYEGDWLIDNRTLIE